MIENAPRDHARALRAIRLRKAYAATGDRRKLKRAKRIQQQLYRGQMRRFELGMRSMSQVLRDNQPTIQRAVERISNAFAQIRSPLSIGYRPGHEDAAFHVDTAGSADLTVENPS